MKKILLSLSMIVFAGAVIAGATGAFFNDTETSSGNTFTAGAIDLRVDSESHWNGMVCVVDEWHADGVTFLIDDDVPLTNVPQPSDACDGTWEETDLGPSHKFFNFLDIKPGDSGENTISLHVLNNDAYMCAIIDNMQDDDNGCTEPEENDAGDPSCGNPGPGEGELSQELHFFAWEDDGDNIWEDGELPLFSNTEGPASDVIDGVVYPMYTPQTETLTGSTTVYIGLYWCFGDVTVGVNTLSCDGSTATNITQTDSMTADISFYVEQARNNENFVCPDLPEPRQLVGAETVAYIAPSCDVTVSGTESIQTAVDGAADNSTVCVDNTYDGTGDNSAIRIEILGLTLASTPQGVALDVPVVLSNSNVTVTGFTGTIGQAESPAEQAAFYIDGDADGAEISHNTVSGGVGAAVLTESGGTNGGGLIANNVFTGATQGIYTNPHTGTIVIEYNDFIDNVVGVAGLNGATVRFNEFTHTTPGSEAVGIDSTFDSNVGTINFNNFLDGVKLNDYGATPVVDAENNFFSGSGVTQTTAPADFDFTPEEGAAFPHN